MKQIEVTLISRGKGYMEIANECRELLEMLSEVDPVTQQWFLPVEALEAIVNNADDPGHISDPLSRAVFDFILDKRAKLQFVEER